MTIGEGAASQGEAPSKPPETPMTLKPPAGLGGPRLGASSPFADRLRTKLSARKAPSLAAPQAAPAGPKPVKPMGFMGALQSAKTKV